MYGHYENVSTIPTWRVYRLSDTADCIVVGVCGLGNYVTHNVMWYNPMASNVCTVLETQASTESNRHDMNILAVKGTVHTRLKEIRAKAMVITSANFDVGCLKEIS